MARKKIDPVAKLIWAHMTYANSFEARGMTCNGEEQFWGPRDTIVTQTEMQTMCEKHMETTIAKIRKAVKAEGDVTFKIN